MINVSDSLFFLFLFFLANIILLSNNIYCRTKKIRRTSSMGILGIIVAILFVIFLAMKGNSIIFVAPVASIIVIITNGMDFFPSLIGTEASFMTGLAEFI